MSAHQNGHSRSSLLDEAEIPSILDNQAWSGLTSSYDLKDPHTGEQLYKVATVTADNCLAAVESSAKAFKKWQAVGPFERRAIFLRALALMEQRKDEYIKLTANETTATTLWGNLDWQLAWNLVSETAGLATALRGEIVPAEDGQRAYVTRIPYGVVLGIAPWNAPLILGIRAFANAIMAGNAVIFKTSEFSPKIHTWAAQLFIDAGLPAGVLNVVHVAAKDAASVCSAIISHPAVRKVNFTGSTMTGRKIAEVCAKNLKPVCLELGGKAPVIILKDANLAAAVNSVMFGGYLHSGQICMASDGLFVHESISDEFTALLSTQISSRKAVSKAAEVNTFRGLFSQASADRLESMISDATSKGAKILIGENKIVKNVVQPLVLGPTNPKMQIYSEEIFGPVLTLNTFKTNEEAIAMANASEYGLAASIYGSNESECFAMAQCIEAGQVHINGSSVHDTQVVPHGGLKNSGYGRFNGLEGLREFSTTKTITINIPHTAYPF